MIVSVTGYELCQSVSLDMHVTGRIRFTITASSNFEVPAGPRRSGQSE